MNARNGKIARLPREIRGQLNQRLEQSGQSPNDCLGQSSP